MLFKTRFHGGIRDGSITQTFRAWKSARVVVGHRYRFAPDETVEVTACKISTRAKITAAQAKRAGFATVDELMKLLARTGPETPLYRVRFCYAPEEDPRKARRADTSASALDEVAGRLARMDRLSRRGAWTQRVLELIEKHPEVAAPKLAPHLKRETRAFKADVRKLKELGLTISHGVGYSLAPRGRALLKRLKGE
jgi:hypothetical protein